MRFSSAVTKAFAQTVADLSHWAYYQECHKNKDFHYHMAVNVTTL